MIIEDLLSAINSLLEINEDECQELNARDLIAEKGAGKKVAIVGHFPFITQLREAAKELWVIGRNPREGDYTEKEVKDLMPLADVVGITGTAFTNHTIEPLLELNYMKDQAEAIKSQLEKIESKMRDLEAKE